MIHWQRLTLMVSLEKLFCGGIQNWITLIIIVLLLEIIKYFGQAKLFFQGNNSDRNEIEHHV